MTKERLNEVLKEHEKWLRTRFGLNPKGSRANLRDADLCGADLRDADLRGANLCDADLRDANLRDADLCGADLRDADLRGANLCDANLRDANLCDADLRDANLRDADLCGADLRDADLRGANLCDANLRGADLRRADLRGAEYNERTAMYALACPEKGAFIGYKKAGGLIVELQITETAKRSSATTRKCRCSEAVVLSITNLDGSDSGAPLITSNYDKNFIYKVGEKVSVSDFDENRWNECSTGIHFFITRDEAVRY